MAQGDPERGGGHFHEALVGLLGAGHFHEALVGLLGALAGDPAPCYSRLPSRGLEYLHFLLPYCNPATPQ